MAISRLSVNICDNEPILIINELACSDSHNLTEEEVNYVCLFDFKTSGFYGLPKIHKSKIIFQEAKVQKKPYIRVLRLLCQVHG